MKIITLESLTQKEILTRKETAVYLSCCLTTLDRLPIPRIKAGRCVRYKKTVLDKWLESQSTPKQGHKMNKAPEKFLQIAQRLIENTRCMQYGTVTAELKIHDGRIVSVMYSTTENTREIIK